MTADYIILRNKKTGGKFHIPITPHLTQQKILKAYNNQPNEEYELVGET
jgi:hypothetical protein